MLKMSARDNPAVRSNEVRDAPHSPDHPLPNHSATRLIASTVKKSRPAPPGMKRGRRLELDKLPPELGPNPDPQKLFEWVKSNGLLPAGAGNHAELTLPVSDKAVENVSGMLNWLALTVLLAALAMGGDGYGLWRPRRLTEYLIRSP